MLAALLVVLTYFEISAEASNPNFDTRIVITNTSDAPQTARVKLWSDHDTPVLWFSTALPARGSKSISLRDVLVFGKFDLCANAEPVPVWIPESARCTLTSGCPFVPNAKNDDCSKPVAGRHAHAIGYATIDPMTSCDSATTSDDAVLTGRFEQIANGKIVDSGPLAARGGFQPRTLPGDPLAEPPPQDCSKVVWYCVPPRPPQP